MKCEKCNFDNKEHARYCKNCGNELITSENVEISKTKFQSQKDPYFRSYRIIFNICFYSVIGFVIFAILLSIFIYGTPAGVLGTIMNIFFNIWIWPFIIFIFIFRKTRKMWSLILSIIFGGMTIVGAFSPIILPYL